MGTTSVKTVRWVLSMAMLIAVATAVLALLLLRPAPTEAQQAGVELGFVQSCDFRQSATFDPIKDDASSHRHEFFGGYPKLTADRESLLTNGTTTCSSKANMTSMWMPALIKKDGTRVVPTNVNAYYRVGRGINPDDIRPGPPELEVIAGDHMASAANPQPISQVNWSCSGGMRDDRISETPINCPTESDPNPVARVVFPDCSNGNGKSPDHKSHMAYSQGGECPSGFFPVPRIQLAFDFPYHANVQGGRLSSDMGPDDGYSNHADYMKAWRETPFQRLINRCIKDGTGCDREETDQIADNAIGQ